MSGGERKKNKSKNELYYISFHPSDSSNLDQKILFCSLQDSQIPDKSQTTLVKPLCLCRDLYPSNLSEFDCFHVVLLERCWTAQLWRWARPLINHFCRNIAAMRQKLDENILWEFGWDLPRGSVLFLFVLIQVQEELTLRIKTLSCQSWAKERLLSCLYNKCHLL